MTLNAALPTIPNLQLEDTDVHMSPGYLSSDDPLSTSNSRAATKKLHPC
jgi:hypothetical protein